MFRLKELLKESKYHKKVSMVDTNLVIKILKALGEYSQEDSTNVERSFSPTETMTEIEEPTKETTI